MSDAGFILGGALQGIGAGIVAQGQAAAAQQAETAKERREMVLAQIQHQNKIAEDNNANQNSMKRDAAQSDLKKSEAVQSADLQDRNAGRATQRNTASQITIDKAKTQNDMALARLRSTLNINEQQAKSASDLSNQLAAAGQEVGEFKVGTDGTVVAFSKTGKVLGKMGSKGQFVADHTNGTTVGSTPFPGAGAGGGAVPANRPGISSFLTR